MSKSVEINRHPILSDKIIYSAIRKLNLKYKTRIDPEQFFDSVTSNFCLAVLDEEVLSLSFPVVATSEYARVHINVVNENPVIEKINFNDAFKKEIKRVGENWAWKKKITLYYTIFIILLD